jgi:hypothetical protein
LATAPVSQLSVEAAASLQGSGCVNGPTQAPPFSSTGWLVTTEPSTSNAER